MQPTENITQNKTFSIKADSNSIVKCDNCGWDWKFSTGGKLPLFCHKCSGKETKPQKQSFNLPANKKFTPLPEGKSKQKIEDKITKTKKVVYVAGIAAVLGVIAFLTLKKK